MSDRARPESSVTTPTAQSRPGWVSRSGIAPYSIVFSSRSLTPSLWRVGLDEVSVEKVSCQAKTAMFAAIKSTVTRGKRSVGRLSRSGSKPPEAYLREDCWVRRTALGVIAGLMAFGPAGALADTAIPPPAHVVAVDTNVTIHYGNIQVKAFTKEFRGRVKSPNDGCEKGRTVKVFHRKPGPDTLVNSTTSAPNGSWSFGNDIAHGRHYAKVKSKAVGSKFCKSARSKTIKVS